MGQNAPAVASSIICNGQGPVISVQPTCLDFGETEVLQARSMSFRIINDSPISAQFKIISVIIWHETFKIILLLFKKKYIKKRIIICLNMYYLE